MRVNIEKNIYKKKGFKRHDNIIENKKKEKEERVKTCNESTGEKQVINYRCEKKDNKKEEKKFRQKKKRVGQLEAAKGRQNINK